MEEVFVTGSLIPEDFVSKAPIATITSSQFEMSKVVNGKTDQLMPQVVGELIGRLLLVKVSHR